MRQGRCRGGTDPYGAGSGAKRPSTMAGGAILFGVMMAFVLPWANPVMKDFTPRGPFFIGHLVFGMVFGLVAFPLLKRRAAQVTSPHVWKGPFSDPGA